MVLVLILGGGLGWIVDRARVQREAVAAIRMDFEGTGYNWEWKEGSVIRGGKPWAPRWLVDRMGVDYFGHIAQIQIQSVSENSMLGVGRLNRLEELRFTQPCEIDAALVHIEGLTNLANLYLGRTQVTDCGLLHL
jgi:internalin A